MEIKYRLYPYPVLSSFSEDYKTSSFDTSVQVTRDGYDLQLLFQAELSCSSLWECIQQGLAKIVYHLECAQTGFRTVIKTDKENAEIAISSKQVNGSLQICSFIAAVEDLKGYSSDDFHEDYEGLSFDIEAGGILAVGKETKIDIFKDLDKLANNPSIFSISKTASKDPKQMVVDYSQQKIVIKLPEEDFNIYKRLSHDAKTKSVLNSLVVMPALLYVLEGLKAMSPQERNDCSDNLWYKVLSRTLEDRFKCNIEEEKFNDQDSLVLSQKLINSPLTDAFKFLSVSFEQGGDEE